MFGDLFHCHYGVGGYDTSTSSRSSDIYRLNEDALVYNEDELASISVNSSNMWLCCVAGLRTGRSHHSCIAYQDKIWVVGGITRDSVYAGKLVELLNPVDGTCEAGPDVITPRFSPHLLILDDILFCIGGDMVGHVRCIGSIERFDPLTCAWQHEATFPMKRTKCSVFSYNDRIYVFGGSNPADPYTMTTWDYYCIKTKRWASTTQSTTNDAHQQYDCDLIHKLGSLRGRDKGIICTKAVVLDYSAIC